MAGLNGDGTWQQEVLTRKEFWYPYSVAALTAETQAPLPVIGSTEQGGMLFNPARDSNGFEFESGAIVFYKTDGYIWREPR
jgi:hypothetical protein